MIEFIKCTLICDQLLTMDSYDPNISFILCWKLITGCWIWYCINNIWDCKIFIIQTSSTGFHVNLNLHPLHFVIQHFSHIKLSYPSLEIKLVLIYWIMKILQSHILLIQYQIQQPVINFQHRINEMFGS